MLGSQKALYLDNVNVDLFSDFIYGSNDQDFTSFKSLGKTFLCFNIQGINLRMAQMDGIQLMLLALLEFPWFDS